LYAQNEFPERGVEEHGSSKEGDCLSSPIHVTQSPRQVNENDTVRDSELIPHLNSNDAKSAGIKPCRVSKGLKGANDRIKSVAPKGSWATSSPPGKTPSPTHTNEDSGRKEEPFMENMYSPRPTPLRKSP